MTSLAFDTLKAPKALRAAGFDDAQTEAVISTAGDAMGENVATKADIQEMKGDLQALEYTLPTSSNPSTNTFGLCSPVS